VEKTIREQIAEELGVPVECVEILDMHEDELYTGPPGGDLPAATGTLSVKVVRRASEE